MNKSQSKKSGLNIKQLFGFKSFKPRKIARGFCLALLSCSWFTVWTVPAVSADRISFTYGVFGEFYISLADLEIFAKTGKITPSLAYYADRFSPKDLAKLRDLLNRSFDIDVVTVNTFLNLSLGRELIRQMGLIIASPVEVSHPAIRASLILAAAEPEGLTILNVLRLYSTDTLRLNTERIFEAVNEATKLLADTERVFQALEQEATTKTDIINVDTIASLETEGTKKWRIKTITFDSNIGTEQINGVVYLPVTTDKPVPLVVIAPGLNTNWQNFSYIAEHLASYGFGVAAVNFPGTNARRVNKILSGLDTPPPDNQWVEQPKIVTQLLNEIDRQSKSDRQWQGKLNLQKVGIIGQSLGGYTAMAIAGAKVDWQHLQNECRKLKNSERINFNPALFWQCQAPDSLPKLDLKDERIVATISINPVTNPIFSQSGMSRLDSPLMMIAGDRDFFAPAIDEQLKPFTWLPNDNKYLVMVENTTHFSFIDIENNEIESATQTEELNSTLARSYLKILSVAFFQTHLAGQDEFSSYLTESYLKKISQQPLPINLLRSLKSDRLQELINE